MNTRYLLLHPEWGIYLGAFIGMGFWSKLDHAGLTRAITFHSAAEAIQHSGKTFPVEWKRMVVVPILIEDNIYATLAEIVAAGEAGWDPGTGEPK